MVAVKRDQQVIAHAVGDDAFRADAGGEVGDLVVNAINGLDMLRCAAGADVVLADGIAGSVLQGEIELCHVAFLVSIVFFGELDAPKRPSS